MEIAVKDAETLHNAISDIKVDFSEIINLISFRKPNELVSIRKPYKLNYENSLITDLKNKFSEDNFGHLLIALFRPKAELDCVTLRKILKDSDYSKDDLIPIIASKTNIQMQRIKERYKKMYKVNLADDLSSVIEGNFKEILLKLINTERSSNNNPKLNDCEEKAKKIYEDLRKEDFNEFIFDIFSSSSRKELKYISQFYFKISKKTMIEAIENIFFQGLKDASSIRELLKAVLKYQITPFEFFADLIHDSIEGLGTSDTLLIRTIVQQRDDGMNKIKEIYKIKYKKELIEDIRDEVQGEYLKLMEKLIE